ncbi:hypothetical protein PINS_up006080 [Pythium insidiosum]|nr:hypothetical protein PINS_up006080 [Pythium insidiosum]
MASATKRLTRGALKKISDSADGTDGRQAPQLHEQQRQLVDEHRAFQQGLEWPAKRRRLSVAAADGDQEPPKEKEEDDGDGEAMGSMLSRCHGEADVAVELTATTTTATVTTAPVEATEDSKRADAPAPLPELSCAIDEKALDGAPEGDLYVVNVLSRDEIQPSQDVDAERQELERVLALSGGDDTLWATEYAAIDSLRRLAVHHQEQLDATLLYVFVWMSREWNA